MYILKLFLMVMLVGSILAGVSASNFLSIWTMLELNMIVFMFILFMDFPQSTWNSLVKYFFVQSIASSLFMFGALIALGHPGSNESVIFVGLALLMKLGSAPMHHWYISVLNYCSWGSFFILSTFQKLLPLFLISSAVNSMLFTYFGILNMVMGALALNQTLMKQLLGYSSIFNLSWMLVICWAPLSLYLVYSMYTVVMGALCFTLYKNMSGLILVLGSLSKAGLMSFSFLLMNLGGVPPTLGFMLKLLILNFFYLSGFLTISFLFLIFSAVLLAAYLKSIESQLSMQKIFFCVPMNLSRPSWAVYLIIFLTLIYIFYF